jgi:ribosome-associated heat shock protein Hsp15
MSAAKTDDRDAGLRADVWLWRARFAKTRAAAARLILQGGVRLTRAGQTRRLEKPGAALHPGDALLFSQNGSMRALRVAALGARRGPPAEARTLYADLAEAPNTDLAGLA